jgi:hypothetical protein
MPNRYGVRIPGGGNTKPKKQINEGKKKQGREHQPTVL